MDTGVGIANAIGNAIGTVFLLIYLSLGVIWKTLFLRVFLKVGWQYVTPILLILIVSASLFFVGIEQDYLGPIFRLVDFNSNALSETAIGVIAVFLASVIDLGVFFFFRLIIRPLWIFPAVKVISGLFLANITSILVILGLAYLVRLFML